MRRGVPGYACSAIWSRGLAARAAQKGSRVLSLRASGVRERAACAKRSCSATRSRRLAANVASRKAEDAFLADVWDDEGKRRVCRACMLRLAEQKACSKSGKQKAEDAFIASD